MVSILFYALMVLWALSEQIFGRLGLRAASVRSDRGSAVVVLAAFTVSIGLAFAARSAHWQPIGAEWVQWLGLLAMAAGLGLRIFSILWLGTMFTRFVQIVPGHRLVTNGPYHFVRHPTYSGLLLFFVGMGLALGDWLSVAAMALIPAVGIAYRIRVEEQMLLAAFGEEYRAYTNRVRKLIPFIL